MYVKDVDATLTLWKQRGSRFTGASIATAMRLSEMIYDFEYSLRGTPPALSNPVRSQIRGVRDKQDLWELRNEIFALVARCFDQWEAKSRVDELNRFFQSPAAYSRPSLV
jgi:hypothetical protein